MSYSDSNIIIASAAFIIVPNTQKEKTEETLVGDKFKATKDSG
jgi:hypothetical protein